MTDPDEGSEAFGIKSRIIRKKVAAAIAQLIVETADVLAQPTNTTEHEVKRKISGENSQGSEDSQKIEPLPAGKQFAYFCSHKSESQALVSLAVVQ